MQKVNKTRVQSASNETVQIDNSEALRVALRFVPEAGVRLTRPGWTSPHNTAPLLGQINGQVCSASLAVMSSKQRTLFHSFEREIAKRGGNR